MKPIRTRLAVAVASSALLASGLGAVAAAAISSAPALPSAGAAVVTPCPNTTVVSLGVCQATT
jgi:hypothetical protein